ncbi:ribonuclease H1 isoform X1 [Hydra vulgaris]|uniref:Ribonuclease H1 n=1 Tax=Hydra vulgaris TaxID=6087 RepID=T2MIA4_HYDVU|nr:ribonuclease H1 [Hydra vulgaris]
MLKRFYCMRCEIMPFYAVRVGRKPGIYETWKECQLQVEGYPDARYKKFKCSEEANNFLSQNDSRTSIVNILGVKKTTSFKIKEADKSHNGFKSTLNMKFIERIDFPTAPVVYSDGCCLSNGSNFAVGGVGVYWGPYHPKNVSEYLDVEQPTNQKAELVAACRALETAIEMNLPEVELRTDSMYTIKAMTEWIQNWESNGWKNSSGGNVVNKEEMLRLSELCAKISVTWVHIPGHKGVYGNEQADQLANQGAQKII